MKTINDLKQEFLDHIATLDKSSMTTYELCTYAELLKKTADLFEPSYMEMLSNGGSPLFSGFAGRRGK